MEPSYIGLGCAAFGNVYSADMSDELSRKMVETALDKGLNYFDTSPWYGGGLSESRLGLAISQQLVDRKQILISTKAGRYVEKKMFDFSASKLATSVENSLTRLNTNYIDILYAHDVEFSLDPSYIANDYLLHMQALKERGIVKNIGISGYDLKFLAEVKKLSPVKLDYILSYARHTLLDSSLLNFLDQLKQNGTRLVCASITGMGLLTNKCPPEWHPASQEIKLISKNISNYLKSQNIDVSQFAHAYTAKDRLITQTKDTSIDHLIIGACNLFELNSNISAINSGFTDNFAENLNFIVKNILKSRQNYNWENVEIDLYRKRGILPAE